eukprot:EG_transcript_70
MMGPVLLALFLALLPGSARATLNISFVLSTYQTSVANVTVYVLVAPTISIPSGGQIVLTIEGTTSQPPGSSTKTVAFINCSRLYPGYSPIPGCATDLFFPQLPWNAFGPYTIQFTSGLAAGTPYVLALDGLYNQAAEGQAAKWCSAYTSDGISTRLETAFVSTQFTYFRFFGEFRLNTYTGGVSPVALTAYFYAGQATNSSNTFVYVQLSNVGGSAVLNCTALWNASAVPLPGCAANRLVTNGNPYRIQVDSLATKVMYSFSLSNLSIAKTSGITAPHALQLTAGTAPFNTLAVPPFLLLDDQAPTLTGCPANITVSTAPLQNTSAPVSWTPPTASDNLGVVSFTSNYAPGARLPFGVTQVTYVALDASNNNGNCTFSITVLDTEAPRFTCPANQRANTTLNAPTAPVSWPVPAAVDNVSPNPTVVSTQNPGTLFSVGVTPVTYVVTDSSGNNYSCTFTVTVTDVQSPTVTCPANASVFTDLGLPTAVVTWAAPAASDNVGIVSITSTVTSGFAFPTGTTLVRYTVADAAGNAASCTFYVTVTDNQQPVVRCPGNITLPTLPGLSTAIATWATPNATDNVGVASLTPTPLPGTSFSVGTTAVRYVAYDAAGNAGTCSFLVTVVDQEPPVVACSGNITVSTSPGKDYATVSWASPIATDNVGVTDGPTCSAVSGSRFNVGARTVTCWVGDAAGNNATCTFFVTVQDTEAPVITCPSNIVQNTDPGRNSTTVQWTVTATDNVGTPTVSGSRASGTAFFFGTTAVQYNATEAASNLASCSFTVTILDVEPPTLTCPANITVLMDTGKSNAVVSWAAPTASDNVALAAAPASVPPMGSAFAAGLTVVRYTVQDTSGNSASCNFTVYVVDREAPTIICPPNRTMATAVGAANQTVSWNPPLATDNVGVVSVAGSIPSGSVFQLGATAVTYTAKDAAGNAASCTFTVTILDQEKPTIACPRSQFVGTDAGQRYATVAWAAPAVADNVGVRSVNSSASPGRFNLGPTVVTYIVTDTAGNVQTCSFLVVVSDTEPPTVTCPGRIVKAADTGRTTTAVTWPAPTATDNVAVVFQQASLASGSVFRLGNTSVTFVARDSAGNANNCTWQVSVIDTEAPRLACPSNLYVLLNDGSNRAIMTWPAPAASDNDRVASVNVTQQPGTYFSGRTNVTYTATDPSGNGAQCTFLVVVSTFHPNVTLSTVRTGADVTVAVMFRPEVTVPALGTLRLVLPGFTGNASLSCFDTPATPLPGCQEGPATDDTGVTSLLSNSPYVIRVNYAWSLLAGQVYGFSLTGLRNPTVPGKTSNLTMQTLDATGQIIDENPYIAAFDIMAVLISNTQLTVFEMGNVSFNVSLDSPPSAPARTVTVRFNASDATQAYAVPAEVTFDAAHWNLKRTVTVFGVHDFVADGNQSVTFTTSLVTTDPRWLALKGDVDSVAVTVVDIDVAGLAIVPPNPVTSETGRLASVAVRLTSKPLAPVFVYVSSADPSKVTVTPASLQFTPATWRTPKNVTLQGLDDLIASGDELVQISFQPASQDPTYNQLAPAVISATRLDNDVAGIEVTPLFGKAHKHTVVSEPMVFSVRLRSQPINPIVLTLTSNVSAEVLPSVGELAFDASNWDQYQTFQALPDPNANPAYVGDVPYQVTLAATSGDVQYVGLNTSVIVVIIYNNNPGVAWYPDLAGYTFVTREVLSNQYEDPIATFWLNTQPSADITLVFTTSDATQGTAVPNRTTIAAGDWQNAFSVTIVGYDENLRDADTPFTVTVIIESEDPAYAALNYTLQAINLARRFNDSTVASQLLSVCLGVSVDEFDQQWFAATVAAFFNVTTQQVNVDSYRACTTTDQLGMDLSQWYWMKFRPQALTGGTNVWFNFVGLPATLDLPRFEAFILSLFNSNTTLRLSLGATSQAAPTQSQRQRSVITDGCPRSLQRYFGVTVEVMDGVQPYSPVTGLVWAVHDSQHTNALWATGRYAFDPHLHSQDGLKVWAETGNASALLEELAAKQGQGIVEAYGSGSRDPGTPVEVGNGQKVRFGFYARPGDYLNLAAKLVRANDRFVGNDEWGQRLFDSDCNPQWGTTAEMFLYDAGTAVNQPFWANLNLGHDSRQLDGGSYYLGQTPEQQLVRLVPTAELQAPGDVYPLPGRLVRVTLDRGLDVELYPLVNAFSGGNATVQVALPPDVPLGNELRIHFPADLFGFNANGRATRAVVLAGLDAMPQLPPTVVSGSTVIVRFNQSIALTGRLAVLLVDNLRLPPVCGETEYSITTHQCDVIDLHGAGRYFYRQCGPPLTTIVGTPPNGMPQGCDACHSCVFQATVHSQDRYLCYTPEGLSFLRIGPLGAACADNPYTLAGYGAA